MGGRSNMSETSNPFTKTVLAEFWIPPRPATSDLGPASAELLRMKERMGKGSMLRHVGR